MITRDEAFELLKKYNKDPFHIQHSLTVEAVMRWYAAVSFAILAKSAKSVIM